VADLVVAGAGDGVAGLLRRPLIKPRIPESLLSLALRSASGVNILVSLYPASRSKSSRFSYLVSSLPGLEGV